MLLLFLLIEASFSYLNLVYPIAAALCSKVAAPAGADWPPPQDDLAHRHRWKRRVRPRSEAGDEDEKKEEDEKRDEKRRQLCLLYTLSSFGCPALVTLVTVVLQLTEEDLAGVVHVPR